MAGLRAADARAQVADLKNDRTLRVVTSGVGSYDAILLNLHGKPPYDKLMDLAVREAAAYGIDRKAVVDNIWKGNAEVMQTFIPVPDRSERVAVVSCSSPVLDLADSFFDIFDAITSTFRFTPAADQAGEVQIGNCQGQPQFLFRLAACADVRRFALLLMQLSSAGTPKSEIRFLRPFQQQHLVCLIETIEQRGDLIGQRHGPNKDRKDRRDKSLQISGPGAKTEFNQDFGQR